MEDRAALIRSSGFVWSVAAMLLASSAIAQEPPRPLIWFPPALFDQYDAASRERFIETFRDAEKAMLRGPAEVPLGGQAKLEVPDGVAFIPREHALRLGAVTFGGNTPEIVGYLADAGGAGGWHVEVEFLPSGHVHDRDANLDPDELLASAKARAIETNASLRRSGEAGLQTLVHGWIEPPRYDSTTRSIRRALRLRTLGSPREESNYAMFVLGREGYFRMTLKVEVDQVERLRPLMLELIRSVQYLPGKRYADYVEGADQAAPHGIRALVIGESSSEPRATWPRSVTIIAISLLAGMVAYLGLRRLPCPLQGR